MEAPNIWAIIATAISSALGGGGAIKLYDLWLKRKKTDQVFINEQYQALVEQERKSSTALRRRIDKLEHGIDDLKLELEQALIENIKLKAMVNK